MERVHHVKASGDDFWSMGSRPYDVRLECRDFQIGDYVVYRFFDAETERILEPWLTRKISHIERPENRPGLSAGFVVLGFEPGKVALPGRKGWGVATIPPAETVPAPFRPGLSEGQNA